MNLFRTYEKEQFNAQIFRKILFYYNIHQRRMLYLDDGDDHATTSGKDSDFLYKRKKNIFSEF